MMTPAAFSGLIFLSLTHYHTGIDPELPFGAGGLAHRATESGQNRVPGRRTGSVSGRWAVCPAEKVRTGRHRDRCRHRGVI